MADERYDFTRESYEERKEQELAERKKEREKEEAEQKRQEEIRERQLRLEKEIAEEEDRIDKARRARISASRETSLVGRSKRRISKWGVELKRLKDEYNASQKKQHRPRRRPAARKKPRVVYKTKVVYKPASKKTRPRKRRRRQREWAPFG